MKAAPRELTLPEAMTVVDCAGGTVTIAYQSVYPASMGRGRA